jgi:hypothetical protein
MDFNENKGANGGNGGYSGGNGDGGYSGGNGFSGGYNTDNGYNANNGGNAFSGDNNGYNGGYDNSQYAVPNQNITSSPNSDPYNQDMNFYSASENADYGIGADVVTKKSFKKLPVIIAAALVAIIAASTLCYAFVPSVKNFVRLNTMSPEKYFKTVQTENFEKSAKVYADEYGALLDQVNNTQNVKVSTDIELTPAFMAYEGDSSEFPDGLKISGDVEMVAEKDFLSMIFSLVLNDVDFNSLNMVIDTEGMYAQYPYASESWLGVSFADLMSEMGYDSIEELFAEAGYDGDIQEILAQAAEFDPGKYLSPEQLETLLNKYNKLCLDAFTDVSIEKSKELTINGITEKFAVTTATMSDREFKELLITVLENLEEEAFITDIIDEFAIEGLDKHAYRAGVEYVISFLDESWDDLGLDFDITLDTYVNTKGELAGNEITVDVDIDGEGGTVTVAMLQTTDGDDVGVEGYLSIKGDGIDGTFYPLAYKGKLTVDKDKLLTGTVDITIKDSPDDDAEEIELPVEFKKFGFITEKGQSYPVGNLSFTLEEDGEKGKFDLGFTYNNGSAMTFEFSIDDEKMMIISFGVEYDAATRVDAPDQYFTEQQTDEFLATVDMDKMAEFAEKLNSIFGTGLILDDDGSFTFGNDYDIGDYDSYNTGYGDGWSAGYLDAQQYDEYENYDDSAGDADYREGYSFGYEDGYSSSSGTQITEADWGGAEQGAYYGRQAGEYDGYYDEDYGTSFYDSNGDDEDYDRSYASAYNEGYNKYVSANGVSYNTSKPLVTNPVYNTNKGSVSTEPLVTTTAQNTETAATTTATTVTISGGSEYVSGGIKVTVPKGYNASEESGIIEVSNQDNLLSIESKYGFKYTSAKAIAALYSAAGMTITSENENFSVSGLKAFKVDFIADGTKGFVVYITQGSAAPYVITSNGNDVTLLENILNTISLT